MHIWILAKRDKFDAYENVRFRDVAEKMEIMLTYIDPDECEIITTKEGRKSLYVGSEPTDELPDCVIPRTGSGTTYFASAVIRHLERLGVFVMNKADAVELAKDKLATTQTLASNNVPIPKTLLGKYPIDLSVIEREF
ncbi:RimK family alpha-L-glutamate ligase, partial [Candidatus Peribacteria bacterium]|nr:RimK family alpha-L-glutamate ligase [Candidatus Peribacteria bacterium]